MERIIIIAEEACPRLDVFLTENLSNHTRSAVKKLIDNGAVTVNGKRAKSSQDIKALDEVIAQIPDPVTYEVKPENIPLDIVYEDDDIAVINKAQGMTVHMGNGNFEGTLVNALLYHLKSLSGINGVIRPGIVHRIDKDTSGLLVVAKNDTAHLSLSRQIAEKSCKRQYIALLEGVLKEDSGNITTYIGRNPNDRIKMSVVPPEKGKIAITDFSVIKRFERFTLCQFNLHTGRTHQIRVHAQHLKHPIVGDTVYGVKKQAFKLNGQLLHAEKLVLTHPKTGERMEFFAEMPCYFKEVLNKLK
ncbi:MAG: RluA family pseudouridine synthase [Clostridiales bacterium]|nr:RluA family pseudouridine synthase [Clostridiales bacterium]